MKANPERAEVPLVVVRDGVEHEYVLKLSLAAARVLQPRLKKTLGELIDGFGSSDVEALAQLAYLFLQVHHKDEIKSVDAAAALLDEAGVKESVAAMAEVIVLNTPNPRTAPTTIPAAPRPIGDGPTSTPSV
jgi:hypothetical protein